MSLLDRIIQFKLDSADGPLVGTTASSSQRTIRRLLEDLASKYVGREVVAVYPTGYTPKP